MCWGGRPEQKGHAFADDISKWIFFNENYCIMIQISLKSFFFRVSLTTIRHHWVRRWLGVKLATSHYLNQWWPSLLTHICVTQPKWIKQQHLNLMTHRYIAENSIRCWINIYSAQSHNPNQQYENLSQNPYCYSHALRKLYQSSMLLSFKT